VTLGGRPGWMAAEPAAGLEFAHPARRARAIFDAACRPDDPYRDAHAWQFTPASFELLILDLAQAGACDWHVAWLHPEPAVEFLGRLEPGPARFASDAELQAERMRLLREMARESITQWQSLVDLDRHSPGPD